MSSLPTPSPDRLAELFVDLAATPSPSRSERAVADKVTHFLRELGLVVQEDDAGEPIGGDCGNLYCSVPSDKAKPSVAFGAHLDTVPATDMILPTLGKDGVFRNSAGTILGADDKASIAALLHATELLLQTDSLGGAYELLFTVCEEDGLRGAEHLASHVIRSPLAVVLDSSGPVGGVVTSAPSQKVLTVHYKGLAAHAGLEPELGRSAVQAAAKAIAMMKLGRLDSETTANVGVISGGVAANIVPERCEVVAECRGHDEDVLAEVTADMLHAVHLAATEVGVDVAVDVEDTFHTFSLAEDAPVVALATEALCNVGREPELLRAGGGSDANVFNQRGLPTVNLCTGMMRAHSADEHIALSEMVKLCETAISLVVIAPSIGGAASTDKDIP